MALIDDLVLVGIPAALEGTRIIFSRPLTPRENMKYAALRMNYLPAEEKADAFAARPDLASLRDKLVAKIENKADSDELLEDLQRSINKINSYLDLTAPTAEEVAAIVKVLARNVKRLIKIESKRQLLENAAIESPQGIQATVTKTK